MSTLMLPKIIMTLDSLIANLVEIKNMLIALNTTHESTIKAFLELLQLNDSRIAEILKKNKIVITDKAGNQIFPPKEETPKVIWTDPNKPTN